MSSPSLDVQFELPNKLLEKTYSEIVESLTCPSCNGAQIRPSGLHPSATLNLGDAIADITSHLTAFTNSYSIILAIIKMIGCIIEVVCAIANPFALIPAVVRLFAECLPEFVLIFPFFVVPCIIFCFLKIFLAIFQYIITYIAPIIKDLLTNIDDLRDAFTKDNKDAQQAVAFKLSGLLQELFSVVGILSVLGAIFTMIEALLKQGIGIPCSGGSGSTCLGCSDPMCPAIIQVESFTGSDGSITILLSGESSGVFTILFSSASRKADFLKIKNNNLFPSELNFTNLTTDELPYIMSVAGNNFAVRGIDSAGNLSLSSIQNEFTDDGYLSVYKPINVPPYYATVSNPNIRFATLSPTFTSSMIPVSITDPKTYIEIQETRPDASLNTGIWELKQFVDEYSVIITRTDGENWAGDNSEKSPEPFLLWRLIPTAPVAGIDLPFKFTTHHDVLLKFGLIGTGCHPAVQDARNILIAQYPELGDGNLTNAGYGNIPDLNALISDLNAQLATLGPADKDYILDNYDSLQTALENLDLVTPLTDYTADLLAYAKLICPLVLDAQNTPFVAAPAIKEVGNSISIRITPLNRSGAAIAAFGLPSGTMTIEATHSSGQLSDFVEIFDSEGQPTGTFEALLTSIQPGKIQLTATICGKELVEFNGTTLETRVLSVEFVLPEAQVGRDTAITGEVSNEPLGKSSGAGE